ncbi:MAG: V-type ATP synthase subunit I, partial [Saccharolobus sp.]
EERYKELLEEIGRLRAEKDLYQQQLKELEPIKSITVELSKLYSLELFDVILAQVSEDKLRLIGQIIGDSGFAYYTRFEEGKYTVLIITEKNADIEKKLREAGVRKYELQEGKSPFQLYNEISERINQINTILERTREELAKKVKTEENYIKNVYGK